MKCHVNFAVIFSDAFKTKTQLLGVNRLRQGDDVFDHSVGVCFEDEVEAIHRPTGITHGARSFRRYPKTTIAGDRNAFRIDVDGFVVIDEQVQIHFIENVHPCDIVFRNAGIR